MLNTPSCPIFHPCLLAIHPLLLYVPQYGVFKYVIHLMENVVNMSLYKMPKYSKAILEKYKDNLNRIPAAKQAKLKKQLEE